MGDRAAADAVYSYEPVKLRVRPLPIMHGSSRPRHCAIANLGRRRSNQLDLLECVKNRRLIYVTCVAKFAIYRKNPRFTSARKGLEALRAAAARSGRSMAEVIREAIRTVG